MNWPSDNRNQVQNALYMVASPIGNLQDITVRALHILQQVALILCEDTRRARILCNHYAIQALRRSCHAHNERRAARWALTTLVAGKAVAYLSDAGTPAISDPGAHLVSVVRAAGYRVIPLPGASALTALLSVGGIASSTFHFVGFLPPSAGKRERMLRYYVESLHLLVLYEAPHRLLKLLRLLLDLAPERRVIVGRELTKIYEEILSGSPQQLLEHFSKKNPKGEHTLLVTTERIV